MTEAFILDEPKLFTGHCLRRTAAADAGANRMDIQKGHGWNFQTTLVL